MTLLTMTPFKAHCDRADVGPSHPGEILREDLLPYYRLSVADLAQKLGKVFALCPRYWLALQLQYDLWHKTSAVDDDANILPPSWGAYAGAAATP